MDPRLAALLSNPHVPQDQIQAVYDLMRERDEAKAALARARSRDEAASPVEKLTRR